MVCHFKLRSRLQLDLQRAGHCVFRKNVQKPELNRSQIDPAPSLWLPAILMGFKKSSNQRIIQSNGIRLMCDRQKESLVCNHAVTIWHHMIITMSNQTIDEPACGFQDEKCKGERKYMITNCLWSTKIRLKSSWRLLELRYRCWVNELSPLADYTLIFESFNFYS